MTLIADLDLDLLKDLHSAGSVRNLRDRRKDLYSLRWSAAKAILEENDPLTLDNQEVVQAVPDPVPTPAAATEAPTPPAPKRGARVNSHHGVAAG